MQTRRRLADVHKQVDSLQGSTARQPVSREFVSQLYQQLEHWKRLFEQQSNRFAECDLFVARLKSFGMIRLTEYTLLERNLQSSHDQLAEEMQRIRGVLESDSPQQPCAHADLLHGHAVLN